jgi:hypothetical protein
MMDQEYREIGLGLGLAGLQPGQAVRLRVISGSMQPLLRPGDLVAVVGVQASQAQPGDILVVRRGREWITHRLIERGPRGLRTKGDGVGQADAWQDWSPVAGRVMAVERNGRACRMDSAGWRLFNRLLAAAGRWESRWRAQPASGLQRLLTLPARLVYTLAGQIVEASL